MSKQVLILLLICFSVGTMPGISAQGHPQGQHRLYEAQADSLLKKAAALLQSHASGFSMEFTYLYQPEGSQDAARQEGMLLSMNSSYWMELEGDLFISDGLTQWTYLSTVNELHISDVPDESESITPTSILRDYDERFRATFMRQESSPQGDKLNIIDLVPKQADVFFRYRLALFASDHSLSGITAFDRQGGQHTYQLRSMRPVNEMDSGLFSFPLEDYPDVEIIDLR